MAPSIYKCRRCDIFVTKTADINSSPHHTSVGRFTRGGGWREILPDEEGTHGDCVEEGRKKELRYRNRRNGKRNSKEGGLNEN